MSSCTPQTIGLWPTRPNPIRGWQGGRKEGGGNLKKNPSRLADFPWNFTRVKKLNIEDCGQLIENETQSHGHFRDLTVA